MKNKQNSKKESTKASMGSGDLKSYLDSLPDMVIETDTRGNIAFANQVTLDTFGYTNDDLERGLNILEIVVADEKKRVEKHLKATIAGKDIKAEEFKARRKDAGILHIMVHASPVTDAEGKVTRIRVIVVDITERRESEDALKDSESKLRQIFESLRDAIVISDMDLNVIDANQAAAQLAGFTKPEEFIGRKGLDFISPSYTNGLTQTLDKAREGRPKERVEFSIVDASGEEADVELSVSTLYDASEQPSGFLVVGRNVTERKSMENALRESEIRFRELFQHMSSGVTVYEAVGNGEDFIFKDINAAAEQMSNIHKEDFIGKSTVQTRPQIKETGLLEVFQKVWRTGKPEHIPPFLYQDEYASGWRENYIYKLPSGEVVAIYDDVTERMEAEIALRESEEKLRIMFDSIGDGIAVTDMKGTIIDVNKSALRMGGQSRDEIIGRDGASFVQPKDRNLAMAAIQQALEQGHSTKMVEYTLSVADGGELDVELSIAAMHDATGKPAGLIGVVRDITERKKVQAALRDSEEKLRLTFESIRDSVTITDLDGNIVDVNQGAVRIGNFDGKEELIGRNGFDLIAEKDRARAVEDMAKEFGKSRTAVIEYALLKKNGTEYDAEVSISLIRDSSGHPTGTISIAHDITERKQAEQALRESEERYRSVIDNANEAIVVAQDGILKFFNPKAIEILGYSSEKLASTPFLDIIHPDDRQMVADRYLKRLQGEEPPHIYDFRIIDKRKGIKWMEINAVLVSWEGRPATLNFLNDITARREAEEALRESEEKLRLMFESMGDMLVVMNPGGHIVDVNEATLRTLGYAHKEELIGRSSVDLVVKRERTRSTDDAVKAIKTGTDEDKSEYRNVTIQTKDGRELDAEYGIALLRTPDGKLSRIIGIARDITEKKKAGEALRESEGKLRLIFESIGDMLMVMDLTGKIVDVNQPIIRTVGYTKEELIGKNAADLVIKEDRNRVIESTISTLEAGLKASKSAYQELTLVTKDDSKLAVEYCITPMRDPSGKMVGVLGIGRDITDRKNAELAIYRRNVELTAIAKVTQALSQQLRLDRVLQTALDSILEVSGQDTGALWLLDEDSQGLELAIHRGVGEEYVKAVSRVPLGVGITAKAVESGKTIVVSDIINDKKLPDSYKETARLEGLRSVISIPLKSKGKTLGAMNVFSRKSTSFPAEDIRLLETIGGQIGIAIENAQLLERLSELSETDELTGLYNRRTFYEMLDAEIKSSTKHNRPFSLVMLDLDGFKSFNDKFGHTSGDAALKNFANALQSALRKTDSAYRYGGDEFTLILPGTESEKALSIIDRIRKKWLQSPHSQYYNADAPIKFSTGIAQFPDDTETIDGMVFLADTALFIAKREGGYHHTLVSELGELPPEVLGSATMEQVYALAATVDAQSPYMDGHSRRVSAVAEKIGLAIGLDEEQLSQLHAAALLHDIGKIGVPDIIVTKPDSLSKDERRVIEKHPVEGAKILSHVQELSAIVPIVLHHHEWYSGGGYPDGLKGDDIPLLARILTVADSYDTMTTPLPHKKAMTHQQAADELRRYAGIQFDPELVEVFCNDTETRKR